MNTISYPKVGQTKDQKVFVSFYLNNKRYRLYNGKRIGSLLEPNSFPEDQRIYQGNILAAEIYKHISAGGLFIDYRKDKIVSGSLSDIEILKKALKFKLQSDYTSKYKEELQYAYNLLINNISGSVITKEDIIETLKHYKNRSSYNSLRKNLNSIFNQALELGLKENPIKEIKRKRAKANLNKPFENIQEILKEIKVYNYNLYLCSLMTYGCFLRPHGELRELTWGDFTSDLSYIKLSGSRNKSGRNRIVPVPTYIKELLNKRDNNLNIFTGTTKAPNPGYFKMLWRRFKKVSKLLEQDQTLYSFRHSGAIEIYKRSGSLSKLQKAMGHSSLAVSLTYLRGLEVSELEECDMPMV